MRIPQIICFIEENKTKERQHIQFKIRFTSIFYINNARLYTTYNSEQLMSIFVVNLELISFGWNELNWFIICTESIEKTKKSSEFITYWWTAIRYAIWKRNL